MWRIKEPWTFTPQKIKFCYHLSFYKFYNCYNCYFILLFCYHLSLLSVTEALRIAKADSKSSVLILLDLSAAFDTVNHQILLSTLSSLDITGIPLRWFESYLTGRSFKVAGRYLKHINWSLGFPRDRFLDPSSSPHTLHHWLPSYRHMASPTISKLMAHSSISHFDQMIQR